MCFKVHVVQPGMVILADALDPNKKGVGAAQGSCLGDYMAVAIERCNDATYLVQHVFFFTLVFCPESLFGLKPKNQWQAFKLHLTGQVQISFGLGLSLYCGIASLFGYLQYGTSNWNPSNFS